MKLINRILTWPFLVLMLALCTTVSAQTNPPPTPDSDAAGWAKLLYEAFTSHSWSVVAGLVLIGLVYPLRRFGPDILKTPTGGLVLAFLLSLSATMGGALAVHVPFTWGLLASSVATAATAAGVWEWIKAHIPGMQQVADKASNTVTMQAPKDSPMGAAIAGAVQSAERP